MKTKHYNFSGFTLVELIVVITILVILGTIGFTSMSSFSSNARDSSRSSDLAIIAKSLDIGLIKTGSYPDPEDASSVTYSGGTLWKQGIIGDTTLNIINAGGGIKLSSKPTDPLTTTKPYSYSKTSFGNFYQLKSDWEGDSIAYYDREGIMKDESLVIASERSERGNPGYSSVFSHCTNEGIQGLFNLDCFVPGVPLGYRNDRSFIFPQVNASPGNPTLTYIRGNYNGMVAKTEVGNIKYLIAIPSLFLSSSTQTGTIVLTTNTQTGFSLHNQTNSGGISFAPQLVFSSGSLPTTPTEKILFASGIANAYSGNTLFANASNIKPFVDALKSMNTGALESLGGNLVVGSLGGSASATTNGGSGGGFACGVSTISDVDGNIYHTVSVGTQCWMKENIRRGTMLASASTMPSNNSIVEKWCYNNDCTDSTTYGAFYTWAEALQLDASCNTSNVGACNPSGNVQGICSVDWHIPSDVELKTLVESQGGAGCETTTGWQCPSTPYTTHPFAGSKLAGSASNWTNWTTSPGGIKTDTSGVQWTEFGTSGFDVQPSGYRPTGGGYSARTNDTFLWSSTALDGLSSWRRSFNYSVPSIGRSTINKANGFSLRCIKD